MNFVRGLLGLGLMFLVACRSVTPPVASTPPAVSLCGFKDAPPQTYKHVIWLLQENQSANEVVGSDDAPHVNGMLAQCGLASNFHNVSHPSLPNYLAMTSGTVTGEASHSNCPPAKCPQTQVSLFEQVQASGREWRQFAQSMDAPCSARKTEQYEPEHAVPVYYTRLGNRCKQWDLPLGTVSAGALRSGIDRGVLPAFMFITPDRGHESGREGSEWLNEWISLLVATPAYRSGDTAIFVTWDEGTGNDSQKGESCSDSRHADTRAYPSCWVTTIVTSPYTRPGTKSSTYFTHYSLLKTTEELLGLPEQLGNARTAASMRRDFNL